jgi:glutamate mutase epsilon subunit
MAKNSPAKWKRVTVDLPKQELALYAGSKLRAALTEVTLDMDLFKGVKLGQVLEAVYEQGKKDGRKDIIEQFDHDIKGKANYLPPGRPKKSRRK